MAYSLFLIPLCFIKGFVSNIQIQLVSRINSAFKLLNILKWLFFGLPALLYVYFADVNDILKSIYNPSRKSDKELYRMKKMILPEDVVVFLKFIHSKEWKDPVDLHLIFQDYLAFEQNLKAEKNDFLKEKSIYLKALNKQSHLKKSKTTYARLMIHNKDDHDTSLTGSYMKKNLIIIEILENFKIDESFGKKNYLILRN